MPQQAVAGASASASTGGAVWHPPLSGLWILTIASLILASQPSAVPLSFAKLVLNPVGFAVTILAAILLLHQHAHLLHFLREIILRQ